MSITVGLTTRGLNVIEGKLAAALAKVEKATRQGILDAAEHVQSEADKTVPIDTGNLAGSSYARLLGLKFTAVVGYTANYSLYVHESPDDRFFQRPEARARWLALTLEEQSAEIDRLIKGKVKDAIGGL